LLLLLLLLAGRLLLLLAGRVHAHWRRHRLGLPQGHRWLRHCRRWQLPRCQ
jgi:hypothetical protein